jgi:AcrR family transcriptional regulator
MNLVQMNIVQSGGIPMTKIIENPKEAILSHAKSIVVEEGYNNLTMRYVSEKSGISVGTIYNYFPTKKNLTLQLMEDYWNEYLITVKEIDANEADLFIKLHQIYDELVSFSETFLQVWISNSNSKHDEDSRSRENNFMKKINKCLEEILVKAESQGTINLSLDVHETSKFLLLNFIMMAQMKQFEYENFEKIIKKLFM